MIPIPEVNNSDALIQRLINLGMTTEQMEFIYFHLENTERKYLSNKPSQILSKLFIFKDSPEGILFWWEIKMKLEDSEVGKRETLNPSFHWINWRDGKKPAPEGYTGCNREDDLFSDTFEDIIFERTRGRRM